MGFVEFCDAQGSGPTRATCQVWSLTSTRPVKLAARPGDAAGGGGDDGVDDLWASRLVHVC